MRKIARSPSLQPQPRHRAIVEITDDSLARAIIERPQSLVDALMRALASDSNESWEELKGLGFHRLDDKNSRRQ